MKSTGKPAAITMCIGPTGDSNKVSPGDCAVRLARAGTVLWKLGFSRFSNSFLRQSSPMYGLCFALAYKRHWSMSLCRLWKVRLEPVLGINHWGFVRAEIKFSFGKSFRIRDKFGRFVFPSEKRILHTVNESGIKTVWYIASRIRKR